MLAANERITFRQLQILIILSALGTGVIVLPRRVAQHVTQDGWVIVIGLILVAALVGLLISTAVYKASKVKPGAGFVEFTSLLLSRPVAYVLGFILWIKLIFAAGFELRIFLEITNVIMLPTTPIPVVGIAVLLVCAYAAAKGIETRARVAEVLFAVMALPFLFLVGLAIFDTDFSNLQPVLVAPPQDYLNGVLRLGFIFTGMECLLLVSPFTKKDRHMGRYVVSAILFAGAIILLITVLTIAKFGHSVANQPWPVLRMMDMINIPGSFIERQEALIFSFWIITAFAIGNTMLFFGGLLVKDMVKPRKKHFGVLLTALAAFAVAVFPWQTAVYEMLDMMYMTVGVFYLVVLPITLLIAVAFKKRKATLLPLLLFIPLIMTGCWDSVEIENRSYVVAIGIDMEEDEFAVTLSVPLFEQGTDTESDTPGFLQTATGKTITEALKELDAQSDNTLYYGQAKVLVLGNDVLKNSETTNSVINALKHNNEIDLRINVLIAEGTAKEILEAHPPGETLPGLFVAEIYRSKDKLGGTSFSLDLERLESSYRDGVIIPVIRATEDEGAPLEFYGAAALKNSALAGEFSHEELVGFLWCLSHSNKEAIVPVVVNDNRIPLRIKKHGAKIKFDGSGEDITAIVKVNVKAEIEEPTEINSETIKTALAAIIKEEIINATDKLQDELGLDGYDWLELLRKKDYEMYKQHSENWEHVFAQINVVPVVSVELV